MERQYKNVGYFSLLLVGLIGLGFYKPYFSLIPEFSPDLTPLVQVHAVLLMLLVVLLVAQPILLRFKKRQVHKSLGKLTYFLMPVLVLSCIGVAIKEYYEALQEQSMSAALVATYSDVAGLCQLIIFYVLAVVHRRNIPAHMRYMIGLTLSVAPAGISRLQAYWFGVPRFQSALISDLLLDAIVIGLILYDRRHNLNYRPYLAILAVFLVCNAGFIASRYVV